MALLDRLVGWVGDTTVPLPAGEEKINNHAFQGALDLWQSGIIARADVIAGFGVTVSEEVQLDWLKARFQEATDGNKFAKIFDDIIMLAEAKVIYTTDTKVQADLATASATV